MSQHRDEAYVLGTHALGEADLIVVLMAEHAGLVRGVARSARRSRRRFGGALEPLTRVRASWTDKPGRDLHRIDSLELVRSHADMQAEPSRQAACAVLCEVELAVAREEQSEPKLFRLIGAVLEALEQGLDPWTAVRYAEYWTLRLHGVWPDPGGCAECGRPLGTDEARWAGEGGRIVCGACLRTSGAAGRRLDAGDAAFLRDAASSPPSAMGGHEEACRPGGALDKLLRGGIEAFVERSLKTYRHLAAATAAEPRGGRRE